MKALSALALLSAVLSTDAVTIYTTFTTDSAGGIVQPTLVSTATGAAYTGAAAYNLTQLIAPPLPDPMPLLNFPIQLYPGGMQGLSIKHNGPFLGFSVELSVANQILGRSSTKLNVPFLNYIGGLRARAGNAPNIRVGGNSQENEQLFSSFPNGEIINKTIDLNSANPTKTPVVNIAIDIIYAMRNITALLGVDWYFGLPFADPNNVTGIASIAAFAQEVLGDKLIGLQLGNEPDLYGIDSRKRPNPYSIANWTVEWQGAVNQLQQTSDLTNKQILLGPSICCNIDGQWSINQVIDSGFVTTFNSQLKDITVQKYPYANCIGSNPADAQTIYPRYLSHDEPVGLVAQYLDATNVAQQNGKGFVMFETNTGSCGGWSGLSDSFAAALWMIDFSLQMAYGNFTNALVHVGGQNVAYNPFTPPPSSLKGVTGWTTGAIYYSLLFMAEAMGSSNSSQVVDLFQNSNSNYTPGYVIYENNNPTRVALINYMNDPSGASDYTANIMIGGGTTGTPNTTPTSVSVRYLRADTVTQKYNITWAGQTYGGVMESDGRLMGNVDTQTIQCDPNTGCAIPVKASSAALVFLTPDALIQSSPNDQLTQTFATSTTATGKYATQASVDQAVLATSNGRGGPGSEQGGSTSQGKLENNGAIKAGSISLMLALGAVGLGAAYIGRSLVQ